MNQLSTNTLKPSTSSRRRFMRRLAGGVAAVSLYPAMDAVASEAQFLSKARESTTAVSVDESFWQLVKEQFTINPRLTVLNAANLCPSPHTVRERLFQLSDDLNRDVSFQNRSKFGELREEARRKIADYIGASEDEIAIVRNTSEANSIIVGGFDHAAGDEVIVFDQNHPTNSVAWDVSASRYGFSVKRIGIPSPPESVDAVLEAFRSAISSKTRVLAFSEVSNTSGVRIPARQLCTMARERGIYTHIDGAQTFGALAVNLHEMGCDSYAASAHKWFVGPKEAGILYVRTDRIDEIWPGVVGIGWGSEAETAAVGARKFETLGQRDDAAIAAFGTTVDFLNLVGREKIEARVFELAATLKSGLAEIPGITLRTSMDPELSAGVCISKLEGADSRSVFSNLYEKHGIVGAPTGGLRLCPHIYTTMADIEKTISAVRTEM